MNVLLYFIIESCFLTSRVICLVCPSGVFGLNDPSGLPAGQIEVTLEWKFTYHPPSGAIMLVEEPELVPKEETAELKQENSVHEVKEEKLLEEQTALLHAAEVESGEEIEQD